MSKISDLYNQIIREKIHVIIDAMKTGKSLDDEMNINVVEMKKIIEIFIKQNLKDKIDFICAYDYTGEPWYLAINDINGIICFYPNHGTYFFNQEISYMFGKVFLENILKMEKINIEEIIGGKLTEKNVEEVNDYTFEQFIKDSIPEKIGKKRPKVICKDGVEYSIQASSTHYCYPYKDGLEAYEEFEIEEITDWETGELKCYAKTDKIAAFVPIATINEIIKAHGGLDNKLMRERMEKQKSDYKLQKEEEEKIITRAKARKEIIEKIVKYATKRLESKRQVEQY